MLIAERHLVFYKVNEREKTVTIYAVVNSGQRQAAIFMEGNAVLAFGGILEYNVLGGLPDISPSPEG